MKFKKSITQQFMLSNELSKSEQLELTTLRNENDRLKKSRAEWVMKTRRDNYESEALLRKQQKQIDKLLLEINALKVIHSEKPLNNNKQKVRFLFTDSLLGRKSLFE